MSRWRPIFSFGIDKGELDGFNRKQSFVAGYELAIVKEVHCKNPKGWCGPVLAMNKDRIERACKDEGREFALTWFPEDPSESWMQLEIYPSG